MAMTYQNRRFQSLTPLREMQTRLRRSYDGVKQGSAQFISARASWGHVFH